MNIPPDWKAKYPKPDFENFRNIIHSAPVSKESIQEEKTININISEHKTENSSINNKSPCPNSSSSNLLEHQKQKEIQINVTVTLSLWGILLTISFI